MNRESIELAVLHTVAYADVFDYPLRPAEIHRYLIHAPARLDQVCEALQQGSLARKHLGQVDGYITLKGREGLVTLRQARERKSAHLWPQAAGYGQALAQFPFVRMVAVTGALAMGNVDGRLDLDYLVVTEPGYLWLCRAMGILLVRWAQRRGVILCPNYYLSANSLVITDRNLYTAHELAQMIPVSGLAVYQRMRAVNAWADPFLPNASGQPAAPAAAGGGKGRPAGAFPNLMRRTAEAALRSPAGNWLESWEMKRKIEKFRRSPGDHAEVDFCADWCKGHFEGHGRRALAAFEQRLHRLGLESEIHPLPQPAEIETNQ